MEFELIMKNIVGVEHNRVLDRYFGRRQDRGSPSHYCSEGICESLGLPECKRYKHWPGIFPDASR